MWVSAHEPQIKTVATTLDGANTPPTLQSVLLEEQARTLAFVFVLKPPS